MTSFLWVAQAMEDPVIIRGETADDGGALLTFDQPKYDRGFHLSLSRVELFETIRRLQVLYEKGGSR